jgi:peptidoglycan hydrolase-like protein with peptidoglycan-binding domain
MSNLWWKTHRLLRRGSSGPDVERVQRALNDFGYTPNLSPDGQYGEKTEKAVKWFQRMMKLIDDGKVGPVTYSVLMERGYRWELLKPPWVKQGVLNLCWAASLESVLRGAWPGRPRLTVTDLMKKYAAHLKPAGDISPAALRSPVGKDLRFREVHVGKKVRAENVLNLLRNRKPVIIVDNSTGAIMHTRVIYGVRIRLGAIDFLMMDPMKGYTDIPIGNIQALTKIGFFSPNEVTP